MDTSKLAKRLARIQEKSSGGKNIWFKSTEDKQKIRQIPYPHEPDGSPFIEVYFHYNIAGVRSLVCPKETHGEPCPICELAEEFRNQGSKDSWKVYKTLAPKLRTYSPVIVRADDEPVVKLWGYGVTIYEILMEKYLDEDWGDLSDIKIGRDLTVWSIPAKSAGNDSDYVKPKMDVSPNQTPMLAKKAQIVALLEAIPDYLNDGETFPVRDYKELQDIVRKLSDAEDDYEEETTYADTSDDSDATTDESDDDGLSAKLKAMLGDD